MASSDYITNADLSTFIGRFAVLVGTKVDLNSNPGTPSRGVIQSVATRGGVQWAHIVEAGYAQEIVTDGSAIAANAHLTNDAQGRAKTAGAGDVVQAIALYGAAITDTTVLAQVLTTDQSGGGGAGGTAGAFGDGVDGDLVVAAPLTLNRDFYPQRLTVSATGSIITNGFRIYASESITVDAGGSISADGNAAVADAGGAATGIGTMHSGWKGGDGGNDGVGANGSTDPDYAMVSPVGGTGGVGGAGGANAGGAGGVITTNAAAGSLHRFDSAIRGWDTGTVAAVAHGISGGSGGGGGGSNNAGSFGGGGGGGGGVVFLASPTITNAGTISAVGGAGAAGAGGGVGAAGGGGGGGGGAIVLVGNAVTAGTTDVTGGAGGLGDNAGVNGIKGADGALAIVLV